MEMARMKQKSMSNWANGDAMGIGLGTSYTIQATSTVFIRRMIQYSAE